MTDQTKSRYIIDTHKVDKYLLRLLNGEAHKLETWLPNLLATKGIIDRETYDYRTSQFRKKEPALYNTKIAAVINRLEAMRQNKQDVVTALSDFKQATDVSHEKHKQPQY